MKLYEGATTAVRIKSIRSQEFTANVGVHQHSALSPLLFTVIMDEVIKNAREGVIKEFLYTDNLVLFGDSWEDLSRQYGKWKSALDSKGLSVNTNKTKPFCSGEELQPKHMSNIHAQNVKEVLEETQFVVKNV